MTAHDVEAAVRAYREDGWALIPSVATDRELETLRARTRAIMLGEVVHDGLFFQLDGSTGAYEDLTFGGGWEGPSERYRKIEKLERDDVFRAWIDHPLFERVARAVIEGPIVTYRAIVMAKAARGGTLLPWHQDGGLFWGIARDPELQIWTALDDAPVESGCIEVVPGSHKLGLARPLGGMIEPSRAKDADGRAVPVPARAGDVILLHNYLWHRSGINSTDRPRRAFSACYMSEAIRCVRKKRAPRVFPRAFS
jgi:phytanoyl-CoA hydroxylase